MTNYFVFFRREGAELRITRISRTHTQKEYAPTQLDTRREQNPRTHIIQFELAGRFSKILLDDHHDIKNLWKNSLLMER
ncbi:hypothetical protein DERP_011346 [Dermatophagoides pteronyssinus]|uniref:Uncharacterized protein n=1 Tax=Dermatophagoides pteronyssinus TaxID=6956 RepID=A0ABQ8J7B6_DERPT|nr:hypothetical protein DERP_011346 [Dermatophagoides pteronyssinus]